jgi:D-3-phosphoglycerate dehydrogenase / 2-oxoglutarate reductase
MPTILITAPYMMPNIDRFRSALQHYHLDVIVPDVEERMEEEDLLAYAGQFDGTICGDDRYTVRVLENCLPRLRVISKWGTGIDSIDREAAARLGIKICNTPNAFTLPVADSVMGYILAFARQQPWMDRVMKSGEWTKIPGVSLSECTLGVVGVGNIGKAVLRRARAFGMRLLGNDIIPIAPDFIMENGVEMVGLRELLERSDFVSTNCDLNPSSFHLMNARSFGWMKPGAVFLNLARGPLVEEAALISVLQEGHIRGAALDVFEEEPLPKDSPLLKMDQVMLAAHNSNSSPAAWERVHRNTIRNLLLSLGIACEDLDNQLK